jgi:3,4-dihydroxy 2-butanone 4-phosphate synthase
VRRVPSQRLLHVLEEVRRGRFVLLYDDSRREGEVDMVKAASHVGPLDVLTLRQLAGGLICVAIDARTAERLQIPFLLDLLLSSASEGALRLAQNTLARRPYGDLPAFSLSVNHVDTYTGITDRDRSLTIRALAEVARLAEEDGAKARELFLSSFRAPGHVPILISREGFPRERRGHTELAIFLASLAGLPKAMVLCEMLASDGNALEREEARRVAQERGYAFVEGYELVQLAEG